MSWIEKWFLNKIVKKTVVQGGHTAKRITEFYRVLIEAARDEFIEHDKETLDCFLKKCHKEALK